MKLWFGLLAILLITGSVFIFARRRKPAARVERMVESVFVGEQEVFSLLPPDSVLQAVEVYSAPSPDGFLVESVVYAYRSTKHPQRRIDAEIDNDRLRVKLRRFKQDAAALRLPLLLEKRFIDIQPMLEIGLREGGGAFIQDVEPEYVIIDALLEQTPEGPVWDVTFEIYENSDRDGWWDLTINALTGQVLNRSQEYAVEWVEEDDGPVPPDSK
ncbi:MAG: hypothetical protein ACM3QZ_10285 [Solirubrobacterales bacterium]